MKTKMDSGRAIHIWIQLIIEKRRDLNLETYLAFIRYGKAFDKV